jgi:hypothetical protein
MKKAMTVIIGLLTAATLVGCEATAKSDQCEPRWQTTTSYNKIMSTKAGPSPIQDRTWTHTVACYEPPVVTHFGSYFDDPIVICGDGNDTYGWTWFDPLAVAYSPARFAVNTLAVPVSMVKEPPGVLQCSNLDQQVGDCGLAVNSNERNGKGCGTTCPTTSSKPNKK